MWSSRSNSSLYKCNWKQRNRINIMCVELSCSSAGLWQPWPAWQGLHLLASVVHWPCHRQGGGVVRKTPDLRGDWPDWAHPTGRAHLPHWLPGVCLSQTPQRLCRGQPWNPPQTPSCAAQQVRHTKSRQIVKDKAGDYIDNISLSWYETICLFRLLHPDMAKIVSLPGFKGCRLQ